MSRSKCDKVTAIVSAALADSWLPGRRMMALGTATMWKPLFSRAGGLETLFALVGGSLKPAHARAWRHGFGFDPVSLRPLAPIPFRVKNRLYNDMALYLEDPLVGIHAGLAELRSPFRPVSGFANEGASLSAVIARADAGIALHCNAFFGKLAVADGRARWSLHYPDRSDQPVLQHASHPLVSMLHMVLRHGGDASAVVVEVDGLPVALRRRAEDMLGVAVQPQSGGFAITFPAQWLESPQATGRANRIEPPSAYIGEALPQGLAGAVRSVIALHDENFEYDVAQVSAELGTSRRMLQHGLMREGMSYRDMLRNARIDRACRLLRETDAPIAEIAGHVGYSEQANFHRAFIRVTGSTPRQFRETRRAA